MQKRSECTRQRILKAALNSFSSSGYAATGIAEICTAAGVSKGAFYHHFASKQSVFIELIHDWLKPLDESLNAIRQGSQDVPTTLMGMSGLFDALFQQTSQHLPMFLEIWLQSSREPAVWATLIAPYRRYQAYFQSLLETGVSEGSLAPMDSDQTSRALISLAVGLLLQSILDPTLRDWPEVARQGVGIFVSGLRKEHA